MGDMKYKVGDRVKIKSLDWYNENKNEDGNIRYNHGTAYHIFFTKYMSIFCGETVTIKCVYEKSYYMNETGSCEFWTDEMIEGLVEEEMSLDKAGQITDFEYDGLAYTLPNGYIFKDENGNVINATKIVLEKKKKEYPKTFRECQECLGEDVPPMEEPDSKTHRRRQVHLLEVLLICRDVYWKIAGEQMGFGKPWEPDWNDDEKKYTIEYYDGEIIKDVSLLENRILVFPTTEMRDAFKENFKEEIEQCKELL